MSRLYLYLILSLSLIHSLHASEASFELRDGDRVALVGATFIERAQHYGHIETALLTGSEAQDVVVRNLGWSGDSVFGDSRSYFGPPQEGRERLARAIGELQPTVIFVCYGTGPAMSVGQRWTEEKGGIAQGHSHDLESGLEAFQNGYSQMLESITAAAGEGLREVVLVTPPPLENIGAPLPDQVENNVHLGHFAQAIQKLADAGGHRCIDLYQSMGGQDGVVAQPLTNNGVHYTDAGYRQIATHWAEALGWSNDQVGDTEALRAKTIEKNRLFFHRWRPANETYLFLFRKHEQGNNAKEIPMYDPLIKELEGEIEELRKQVRD